MVFNEILLDYVKTEIIEENHLKLGLDDDLFSSGLVDSMGMMRIINFVEKQLKIEIPFEDMTLENFMTIENICNYALNKIT